MKTYAITLKDNQTGEIKTITKDFMDDYPHESVEFMWEDGNYECDCNRWEFFYPDNDEDYQCNVGANRFELVELKLLT